MTTDEGYMKRCLELARSGMGQVAPNPMVGSVVVHEGKIIGEGYHRKYGEAHAEVNAINAVQNKELLKEATLYVNLEPCAHHGKTPPCSDLIIRMEIPKVVIGCVDSFAKVAGKGIDKMRAAGIDVTVGVLEEESIQLNKRFFIFHEKKRPYIILKWAETVDGYIDIDRSEETPIGINWITQPNMRVPVHKWRAEETAIMIGRNTAHNDNPRLNARDWKGINPLRIMLDKDFEMKDLHLFDGSTPTLIFADRDMPAQENLEFVKLDFDKDIHSQVLDELYKRNIQSLIVEGGRTLIQSFIDKELWDEARALVGETSFGKGVKAPVLGLARQHSFQFHSDWVYVFKNHKA